MDRNKIKQLAQEARIHTMRASGASVTDIIKTTGATEDKVLEVLKVPKRHATNNRPPRGTSRGRQSGGAIE